MGSLYPNPPIELSPLIVGLQNFYSYAPRSYNGMDVVAQQANAPTLTSAGTTVASPAHGLTNNVTRIPRSVQTSSNAAAGAAGWFIGTTLANDQSALFPGANGDAGFRIRVFAGLDQRVNSPVGTVQLLFGASQSASSFPTPGLPLLNATPTWIGVYNAGDGTGMKFGYKLGGAVAAVQLDRGEIAAGMSWSPYQAWFIDLNFWPFGPRTFYTVSVLNANYTAFTPVLIGSTTAFAPGRIPLAPTAQLSVAAAGQQTDIFLAQMTTLTYPFGQISL